MKPARVLTALAEELDEGMEGSKVDVPAETEEAARAWIDDYRAKLTRQTERTTSTDKLTTSPSWRVGRWPR